MTELKLLQITVGVGNDVIGWIFLALTVALVNAGKGANSNLCLAHSGRLSVKEGLVVTVSLKKGFLRIRLDADDK